MISVWILCCTSSGIEFSESKQSTKFFLFCYIFRLYFIRSFSSLYFFFYHFSYYIFRLWSFPSSYFCTFNCNISLFLSFLISFVVCILGTVFLLPITISGVYQCFTLAFVFVLIFGVSRTPSDCAMFCLIMFYSSSTSMPLLSVCSLNCMSSKLCYISFQYTYPHRN